jgi:hypothetical protein
MKIEKGNLIKAIAKVVGDERGKKIFLSNIEKIEERLSY